MKTKILTILCTLMLFLPWTIFPLRTFEWALMLPAARTIICGYAAFMIFCGIFTVVSYTIGRAQNLLMKICLVINSIYALVGLGVLGMIFFN